MKLKGIKDKRVLVVGILAVVVVLLVVGSDGTLFTTIQNKPLDRVLDANITLDVGEDSFTWDIKDSFPDELKEKGLNGTILISVTIVETNIDILSIGFRVEGPVPGDYVLMETETGVWTYDYDSTGLTDGTYVFTLEGEVDTTPLYRDGGGGQETFKYDAFNVIWDSEANTGWPEEMFGFPTEIFVIGIGVVVLAAFIGKKKSQGQQIIVMPSRNGGY